MAEEQKQAPAPGGSPRREGGHSAHGGGHGGPRREGGPGGPGGPGGRPRGKRQYFRKKKVCKFCVEKMDFIDYKRADILSQFVQERGKILPRRMTGVCARHQRWLGVAIKRARNIALLPSAASDAATNGLNFCPAVSRRLLFLALGRGKSLSALEQVIERVAVVTNGRQ